jgi:hypothetical protein
MDHGIATPVNPMNQTNDASSFLSHHLVGEDTVIGIKNGKHSDHHHQSHLVLANDDGGGGGGGSHTATTGFGTSVSNHQLGSLPPPPSETTTTGGGVLDQKDAKTAALSLLGLSFGRLEEDNTGSGTTADGAIASTGHALTANPLSSIEQQQQHSLIIGGRLDDASMMHLLQIAHFNQHYPSSSSSCNDQSSARALPSPSGAAGTAAEGGGLHPFTIPTTHHHPETGFYSTYPMAQSCFGEQPPIAVSAPTSSYQSSQKTGATSVVVMDSSNKKTKNNNKKHGIVRSATAKASKRSKLVKKDHSQNNQQSTSSFMAPSSAGPTMVPPDSSTGSDPASSSVKNPPDFWYWLALKETIGDWDVLCGRYVMLGAVVRQGLGVTLQGTVF